MKLMDIGLFMTHSKQAVNWMIDPRVRVMLENGVITIEADQIAMVTISTFGTLFDAAEIFKRLEQEQRNSIDASEKPCSMG